MPPAPDIMYRYLFLNERAKVSWDNIAALIAVAVVATVPLLSDKWWKC